MEECYSGLSFTFEEEESVRKYIEVAISKVQEDTKLSLFIYTKSKNEKRQAIYLEFSDENTRDGREFFQLLINELKENL